MREQLELIKQNAMAALDAAETPADLEDLRVKVLGKKGELTAVLKMMGKLSAEERPVMGQMANAVRAEIEASWKPASSPLAQRCWKQSWQLKPLTLPSPAKPSNWVTSIP